MFAPTDAERAQRKQAALDEEAATQQETTGPDISAPATPARPAYDSQKTTDGLRKAADAAESSPLPTNDDKAQTLSGLADNIDQAQATGGKLNTTDPDATGVDKITDSIGEGLAAGTGAISDLASADAKSGEGKTPSLPGGLSQKKPSASTPDAKPSTNSPVSGSSPSDKSPSTPGATNPIGKAEKSVDAHVIGTADTAIDNALDDPAKGFGGAAGKMASATGMTKWNPKTLAGKAAKSDISTVAKETARGAYDGAKTGKGELTTIGVKAAVGALKGVFKTRAFKNTLKIGIFGFVGAAALAFTAGFMALTMLTSTLKSISDSTLGEFAFGTYENYQRAVSGDASGAGVEQVKDTSVLVYKGGKWVKGKVKDKVDETSTTVTESIHDHARSVGNKAVHMFDGKGEDIEFSLGMSVIDKYWAKPETADVPNGDDGDSKDDDSDGNDDEKTVEPQSYSPADLATTSLNQSPTSATLAAPVAADSSDEVTGTLSYDVDLDKVEELGADEDDLVNDEAFEKFMARIVAKEIKKNTKKPGLIATLSQGAQRDGTGKGYIPDNARDSNASMVDVYTEAVKKLPLTGIEDTADSLVKNAQNWWFGVDCEPPGGSGTGDGGSFDGKGVPKKAIPWIEKAAASSKTKIPAAFFAYIMDRETDFRPDLFASDSNGGTWGLFQINEAIWTEIYGGGFSTDKNNNGTWDVKEPLIHSEYGAKYFDKRLATVRGMRKANRDAAYAKDLTELEALMIAHNSGEGNLQKYPDLPAVTMSYLDEFRKKFKEYGGGEPGGKSDEGNADTVADEPGDDGDDSSEDGGKSSGKLVKPQGKHPKTSDRKSRWGKFHAGTDYGMPIGTDLPAMFDGTVTFSGWMSGYGNYTIVKGTWNGETLGYAYAHQDKQNVKVGDKVQAGEIIGVSGNTGIGTGPHLHLELRTGEFTGPGREHNTADADDFLNSNGAKVGGNKPKPDNGGADNAACETAGKEPGDKVTGGDLSNEECPRVEKQIEGAQDGIIRVARAICGEFDEKELKSFGGVRKSSWIGNKSDHYTGNALDIMINDSGKNDAELGGRVAKYLQQNAKELNMKYVIWDQKIWYPGKGLDDWKQMEDRGSPTQNHKDHVHFSLKH
ncbi:hypothetical protein GCM10009689_17630 [Brevibacterium antiquum]|uniref:peptidoglycan DD-metalloendopeptidase family protein n=1 Tax=Brevibacterium antiquum TaxID=234835 RepID=UPI0018E04AEC|nr:peptidoglycan DD-metalloendopeptidase family protein [Brevibacterium antiquum]